MRGFAQKIGVLLLVLALACLYVGATELLKVRPASAYEDQGVHAFAPYQTYPIQVKNTATGRQGRLHPTKTVFLVYYRAVDGTGYEWKDQAPYRSTAESIVAAGRQVERRVLSIKETGRYITVEGGLTARSYVSGQRRRYGIITGLSAAYLTIYLGGWVVILRKRRKGKAQASAD